MTLNSELPRTSKPNRGLTLVTWQHGAWFSVIAVLCVTIAATYLYLQRIYEQTGQIRDQLLRVNLASEISRRLETRLKEESGPTAVTYYRVLKEFTDIFPDIDPYLIDMNGNISLGFVWNARNVISLEPVNRFLENADFSKGAILGDNPESGGQDIFSAARLRTTTFNGYVYVILHNRSRRLISISLLERAHWTGTISLLILVLTAVFVLAILLRNLLRRMLARITRSLHVAAPELWELHPPEIDNADFQAYETLLTDLVRSVATDRAVLIGKDDQAQKLILGVSHDFRTPLHLIQQYAERITSDDLKLPPQEQQKEVQQIQRNVQLLVAMLSQFNAFNNLNGRTVPLDKQICRLEELVWEMIEVYAHPARQQNISLLAVVSPSLPSVRIDVSLIERALRNLIDNALRHTPAGGRVELELSESSGLIRLQISDTGCGIPQSELASIFKPFNQVAGTGRTNGASGLGLAIVEQIVRAHGSRVFVESVEHRGTRFWFELSAADPINTDPASSHR